MKEDWPVKGHRFNLTIKTLCGVFSFLSVVWVCVCVCVRASSRGRGFGCRRMEIGCDAYSAVIRTVTAPFLSQPLLSLPFRFPTPAVPAGTRPPGSGRAWGRIRGRVAAPPGGANCGRRASKNSAVCAGERTCETALSVARLLVIASLSRGLHSPRHTPTPLCPRWPSTAWNSSLQFLVCILLLKTENFMCILISHVSGELMRWGDANPSLRSLSPRIPPHLRLRGPRELKWPTPSW